MLSPREPVSCHQARLEMEGWRGRAAGGSGACGPAAPWDTGHGVSELRSLTLSFTVLFFLLK